MDSEQEGPLNLWDDVISVACQCQNNILELTASLGEAL